MDNFQRVIYLEDKAEKVKSFEVGKSKTDEITYCKVESNAIDSESSLTDNKYLDNLDDSWKTICLGDKADKLIGLEAGDDFTQADISVEKEREENSPLTNCHFLAITPFRSFTLTIRKENDNTVK